MKLRDYVSFPDDWKLPDIAPWDLCADIVALIERGIGRLPSSYLHSAPGIAVHPSATVEPGAVLKPPCIIGENCFVASYAYLRGGVWLDRNVILGPSVEVKSSVIGEGSKAAHFNFVGDSVIGRDVNIEAGAIVANYRNERTDKEIICFDGERLIRTGRDKFGSLIGDGCRIGANAVLAPGTILKAATVVPRLALVDQIAGRN
jgi:UDP-N-acetylglucosamine diphosphorylase / glucose-1-phosphate thymidylyltransferase / UDP-N-acetylgalactosamine diphosphorylase / glucosamine-1-phosphate N-acetyltransferase / galactosamine-1-phosphate N-acetyltransferase